MFGNSLKSDLKPHYHTNYRSGRLLLKEMKCSVSNQTFLRAKGYNNRNIVGDPTYLIAAKRL